MYLHVLAGLLFLAAGLGQIISASDTKGSRRITHWILGSAMIFHSITYYLIS